MKLIEITERKTNYLLNRDVMLKHIMASDGLLVKAHDIRKNAMQVRALLWTSIWTDYVANNDRLRNEGLPEITQKELADICECKKQFISEVKKITENPEKYKAALEGDITLEGKPVSANGAGGAGGVQRPADVRGKELVDKLDKLINNPKVTLTPTERNAIIDYGRAKLSVIFGLAVSSRPQSSALDSRTENKTDDVINQILETELAHA